MNYLRSAIVLASSASLLALVAGCSEGQVATNEDVAPKTEVASKVSPKYTPPEMTVCPQDFGVKDEYAFWYQVQASRVANYLMGGVDPFDNTIGPDGYPVGWGAEYGPAGMAAPDTGSEECAEAAKAIHFIHDKLYPVGGSEKCDLQKDGRCPGATASASLSNAGLGKACGLQATTLQIEVDAADPDWPNMTETALKLDKCWDRGVSGFFWVMEKVPTERNKDGHLVNVLGIDPEPANLGDPLGATTGATAAATYVNSGVKTTVIEWPGTLVSAPWLAPGTPCSTTALSAHDVTKQIIVAPSATSDRRKCL